jgi:hypothetical protein
LVSSRAINHHAHDILLLGRKFKQRKALDEAIGYYGQAMDKLDTTNLLVNISVLVYACRNRQGTLFKIGDTLAGSLMDMQMTPKEAV